MRNTETLTGLKYMYYDTVLHQILDIMIVIIFLVKGCGAVVKHWIQDQEQVSQ